MPDFHFAGGGGDPFLEATTAEQGETTEETGKYMLAGSCYRVPPLDEDVEALVTAMNAQNNTPFYSWLHAIAYTATARLLWASVVVATEHTRLPNCPHQA